MLHGIWYSVRYVQARKQVSALWCRLVKVTTRWTCLSSARPFTSSHCFVLFFPPWDGAIVPQNLTANFELVFRFNYRRTKIKSSNQLSSSSHKFQLSFIFLSILTAQNDCQQQHYTRPCHIKGNEKKKLVWKVIKMASPSGVNNND